MDSWRTVTHTFGCFWSGSDAAVPIAVNLVSFHLYFLQAWIVVLYRVLKQLCQRYTTTRNDATDKQNDDILPTFSIKGLKILKTVFNPVLKGHWCQLSNGLTHTVTVTEGNVQGTLWLISTAALEFRFGLRFQTRWVRSIMQNMFPLTQIQIWIPFP